jgi:membrane associated rhomboid family serine protease
MSNADQGGPENGSRQPIFLLPGVVAALGGLLVAVHLARTIVLSESADFELIIWLGFLPLRLTEAPAIPGGLWPFLWTPFTHALVHGGWEHLLVNLAWFAIFATPVARRYGPVSTVALFFVSAAAGALAFLLTGLDQGVLIGASGGVAGLTGAATRFMFQPVLVGQDPETGERRLLGRRLATLGEVVRDRRAGGFALIWIVLNAAVPLLPLVTGEPIAIAWQAHLGGFAAGFFLVPLLERRQP